MVVHYSDYDGYDWVAWFVLVVHSSFLRLRHLSLYRAFDFDSELLSGLDLAFLELFPLLTAKLFDRVYQTAFKYEPIE